MKKKDFLDILAKRMLFLTKVILSFFIISVIIFLNYLDLKENIQLKTYVNLIQNISQLGSEKLYYSNHEIKRAMYLNRTNLSLSNKHQNARNSLISVLSKYVKNNPNGMKGQGETRNKVVLMEKFDSLAAIKQSKINNGYSPATDYSVVNEKFSEINYQSFPKTKKIDLSSDTTVDEALDLFLKYGTNEKFYLLTEIDSTILKQNIIDRFNIVKKNASKDYGFEEDGFEEDVLNERSDNVRSRGNVITERSVISPSIRAFSSNNKDDQSSNMTYENLKFKRSYLNIIKKTLIIEFGETYTYRGPNARAPHRPSSISMVVETPVIIDSIFFPSTLYFLGYDSTLVKDLYENKTKQENIRNIYGNFVLSAVGDLSEEVIKQNSEAISILGFDISRKWFPIAMFLTLIFIYYLLYITIDNAQKNKHKIITEYHSDDPLEFLVDKKWLRLPLWILCPAFLLALVLYSSLIKYSIFIYSVLFISTSFCVILGFFAYRKSLSL